MKKERKKAVYFANSIQDIAVCQGIIPADIWVWIYFIGGTHKQQDTEMNNLALNLGETPLSLFDTLGKTSFRKRSGRGLCAS